VQCRFSAQAVKVTAPVYGPSPLQIKAVQVVTSATMVQGRAVS
jgi:hypothetical protein